MTEPFNIDQIDPADHAEYVRSIRAILPKDDLAATRQAAISNHLSLFVRSISCAYGRVTIQTNDAMDVTKLRAMLDASFIFEGRTLVFDSIEPQADHYDFYGSPTTEVWNEIVYKPA